MKRLHILSIIFTIFAAAMCQSCIEDGFSASSADQPTFSTDTLDMGLMFTDEPSTTHRFVVYNRADKGISISRIAVSGEAADLFRLNVDGFSGREFSNVEIRANDSIFIFVEATLPENGRNVPVDVRASLDFLTSGVTRSVALAAQGRDVQRLRGAVLDTDTRFTADKPYQIYDSLVVAPGATLMVEPGAELYFHDGSYLAVRGTLKANGELGKEITMAGDRTGNVVTDITFDLMSRQWVGVFFTSTSRGNELTHTCIRNTVQGVIVDGSQLLMVNSRLRNSGSMVLESYHSDIEAYGSEFAEAADGCVYLHGGTATFNHCTFANYYLFAAISGPIVQFGHINADTDDDSGAPYLKADFTNSIIYGLGTDLSHGSLDGTDVTLRRCLLKSEGSDDANFISCLWGEDPLYRTVRDDYYFDYRIREGSPAIGAADPQLTLPASAVDAYGLSRDSAPDLGAYVYTPEE